MTSLWRLRLPVRSFRVPRSPTANCRFNSTKASDPLRILFCGSDEFSIASLRAVHKEHLENPEAIASINVVHRPGKLTGRGLKELREVPIKSVARELRLRTHEIDTFTGWKPPTPNDEAINLVIAVSFGKLVPPRILNGARYGGLNVHPSLLPDFRGPAPIHHTLLQNRLRTGVTVQTLHPEHFDQGMILAQTPSPGVPIPNASPKGSNTTVAQLTEFLAPLGAKMLVDVLRNQLYVPPLEEAGWYGKQTPASQLVHATMIDKEMGHVDWKKWTSKEIFLRRKVLGDLWTTVTIGDEEKRLVIHELKLIRQPEGASTRAGEYFACKAPVDIKIDGQTPAPSSEFLAVRTADGQNLLITKSTVEGGKKNRGGLLVLQNLDKQKKRSWW